MHRVMNKPPKTMRAFPLTGRRVRVGTVLRELHQAQQAFIDKQHVGNIVVQQ